MLVSVIIPCCGARATLARAVSSVIAQTFTDWEAVVVTDDGTDYAAALEGCGIADERLKFVSTGRVRSGCHNARNVGLAAARGDYIATLDADDEFAQDRLALRVPLAREYGAAVDNVAVLSPATGAQISLVLGETPPARLDAGNFFGVALPLSPVVRRDHAQPRLAGVEYAEDVVANLRLIDRIGMLHVEPRAMYRYHLGADSMCGANDAVARFEVSYGELLDRIEHGDGLDLSPSTRHAALHGFMRKRELNRAFGLARRADPALDFASFAAAHAGRDEGVYDADGPRASQAVMQVARSAGRTRTANLPA